MSRVEIAQFTHPVKGRAITQVSYAGWTVHVDGVAVTVPRQGTGGKDVDDLDVCLREAYAVAGVRQTCGPAAGGARLTEALIATLHLARRLAGQWPAASFDVYRCTRDAWEQTGMAVPYTQLIRALRAALPKQTTLSDYTGHSDRAQIRDLYGRAIELLGGGPGERGAA